ncbi:nuclear transport factor 2 family protein [Mycolicibacterium sp. YH-1]|uniref:nuclear transport factor 2 family protein n=1 Tax=Mycolicibacterium sp. YH-1 TaxID=2908837 RepID=UPI00352F5DA5
MDTCPTGHALVTGFADFWDAPSPARLPELLHPDVVLHQPLAPPAVGIAQAHQPFERFCRCLPSRTRASITGAKTGIWCSSNSRCTPTSAATHSAGRLSTASSFVTARPSSA